MITVYASAGFDQYMEIGRCGDYTGFRQTEQLYLKEFSIPTGPGAAIVRLPDLSATKTEDTLTRDKLLQLVGILVSRLGGGVVIDVVEAVKKFDVEFFQLPEDFAYGVRVKEQ